VPRRTTAELAAEIAQTTFVLTVIGPAGVLKPSLTRVLQELKEPDRPTELEVGLAINQMILQARADGDYVRADYLMAWKAGGSGRGP
jgi:hypothetical protein